SPIASTGKPTTGMKADRIPTPLLLPRALAASMHTISHATALTTGIANSKSHHVGRSAIFKANRQLRTGTHAHQALSSMRVFLAIVPQHSAKNTYAMRSATAPPARLMPDDSAAAAAS